MISLNIFFNVCFQILYVTYVTKNGKIIHKLSVTTYIIEWGIMKKFLLTSSPHMFTTTSSLHFPQKYDWILPSNFFSCLRSYIMTYLLNLKKNVFSLALLFSYSTHVVYWQILYPYIYPYLATFYFSWEGVPSNSFYTSWRKVRTGTQDMTLEAGNEEAMEEHCLLL